MSIAIWITVAALGAACSNSTPAQPKCCLIMGINGGANTCQCPNADAGFSVASSEGKCSILLTDTQGMSTMIAAGGQLVGSCSGEAGL
ncbi:MAG TPA: hypothetical protein VKU41_22290 [Polyangiaceae bacterium]|nr:hypothetical protein [Polyangiaceae bacterium]